MIIKHRLNQAFRNLRKRGLMARQNFMCCNGCAGSAITTQAEKLVDDGKPPLGAVFYHKQDTERLREGKDLYLSYGPMDSVKHGNIGLSTAEVAQIVVEECRKARLRVEWDGSPLSRIVIHPGDPEPPTVWERLG